MKRCFPLLTAAAEYSITTQNHIILALGVLHNFIRVHDPDDLDDSVSASELQQNNVLPKPPQYFGHSVSPEETRRSTDLRDTIAKAMWDKYSVCDII